MEPTFTSADLKNSMSAVLLGYVRRIAGDAAIAEILRSSGDPRSVGVLEDSDAWSSYAQMRALYETAAKILNDPEIGRHIGAEVYVRARTTAVLDRLKALGHPAAVVRYVTETSSRQSRITKMECLSASSRHAVVVASTIPPFERHRVFCDYIAGMLAAVPTIFGMELAQVLEVECKRRGAARCLYVMSWEPASRQGEAEEVDLLGRRLEELTTSFEALEEMASELVSVGDCDAVLEAIAQRAAMAVRAKRYLLAVRLPSELKMRIHAVGFEPDEAREQAGLLLDADRGPSSADCLIADVASSHYGFGRLAAFEPAAGRFLPEERRLLEAYAGHAAAVLESTAALADARERAGTMSALFGLATELAEVTSTQDVARRLAGALHAVVDCDAASVLTWDAASPQLVIAGRWTDGSPGAPAEIWPTMTRIAVDEQFLAKMAFRPEPIDVGATTTEPALAEIRRLAGDIDVVVMPISAKGDCFGLVALTSSGAGRTATAASLRERLTGVAGLAATAFHNASLLDEIRHQALHDALTGLPNRALVLDRIEHGMSRRSSDRFELAVLYLDVDGFKEVNDTFGHRTGDELIKLVAARVSAALPVPSTVGRLGGDEFVVLLEGDAREATLALIAQRLLEAIREPFQILDPEALTLSVTASVGIAAWQGTSAGEMLRDAEVALYEAKAAGKDRAVTFLPAMHAAIRSRLGLEMDLRVAITEGQFFLVYQPTIEIASGRVTGVEALIRWEHPGRGVIPPDEFIPALEDTGLIVTVGRWVLREACRQALEWERRGHRLVVAINVSARQLEHEPLVEEVRLALAESRLDPSRIVLELTETALARDAASTTRTLGRLRDLGVRIAIDDFGTGYSSLAYLREFPIDVLKIDRSFISTITADYENNTLVRTLVQLGRDLGLEVIAEGIEDQLQLDYLRSEGCRTGQGYLISRPLLADALDVFLGAHHAADEHGAPEEVVAFGLATVPR